MFHVASEEGDIGFSTSESSDTDISTGIDVLLSHDGYLCPFLGWSTIYRRLSCIAMANIKV